MVFICGRFIVPVGAIGGSCGMALSGAVVWPFLGSACCVCVCVCVCVWVGGWVGGWEGGGFWVVPKSRARLAHLAFQGLSCW